MSDLEPVEIAIGIVSKEERATVHRHLTALDFRYIETAKSPEGDWLSDEFQGHGIKIFVDHIRRDPCVYLNLAPDVTVDRHYEQAVAARVPIEAQIDDHGEYREHMDRIGDQINLTFWQRRSEQTSPDSEEPGMSAARQHLLTLIDKMRAEASPGQSTNEVNDLLAELNSCDVPERSDVE